MTFADSIRTCLRKFVAFSGRASRSEFWWFVLFVILVSTALSVVDAAIFGPQVTTESYVTTNLSTGGTEQGVRQVTSYGSGPISGLWGLVTLLPLLAAAWRRLHDSNTPGWFALLPLATLVATVALTFGALEAISGFSSSRETMVLVVPFGPVLIVMLLLAFGLAIILLIALCRRSDPGPNRFGPPPGAPA